MSSPIMQAIKQLSDEKNIPVDSVLETIEAALAAAYRKDFGSRNQNIKVTFDADKFDPVSMGGIEVFDVKTVVEDMELLDEVEEGSDIPVAARTLVEATLGSLTEESKSLIEVEEGEIVKKEKAEKEEGAEEDTAEGEEAAPEGSLPSEGEEGEEPLVQRFNPKTEIMISQARSEFNEEAEIGEEIKTRLEVPEAFGRMAAQTAKQVIIQKIRDAEYEKVYGEFKDREKTLVQATVQRVEGRNVLFDLGGTTGLMPPDEQVRGEFYRPGSRLRVFITEVRSTSRGPSVIVSRTHPEIVRQLFESEIPEIGAGIVEIKGLSREAGSRSKVAVHSNQDNVDPIGACIGQRGTRIQTIIAELGGEKIDIIQYDEDPVGYIANALSPAKVVEIALDEEDKEAEVIVNQSQLSLAIGRGGQNVRLASKLTGWRINIKDLSEVSGSTVVMEDDEEPVEEASLPPEAPEAQNDAPAEAGAQSEPSTDPEKEPAEEEETDEAEEVVAEETEEEPAEEVEEETAGEEAAEEEPTDDSDKKKKKK